MSAQLIKKEKLKTPEFLMETTIAERVPVQDVKFRISE